MKTTLLISVLIFLGLFTMAQDSKNDQGPEEIKVVEQTIFYKILRIVLTLMLPHTLL